ncbi:MAG: hypothetical protein ACFFC3_15310 [Candidatus Odinarchaeota archaeon]
MRFPTLYKDLNNIFADLFNGLEAWCIAFNEFAIIFFGFMKFILFFIMLLIGIFTLVRLRGTYFKERMKVGDKGLKDIKEINKLRRPRLLLGSIYIALAFGILFNWLTMALIFVLEPLPDRLIFNFINFSGIIDPFTMNRIMDISVSIYPHEQTIYYIVAFGSFIAITDIIIAVWYMVNKIPFNPKMALSLLIGGIITGILLGFTTCLPFFL